MRSLLLRFRVIPVIIFSIAIFYFSHQSRPPEALPKFEHSDKLIHFIAYFIYGLSLQLALLCIKNKTKFILSTVLIGSLYAASDEFHQSFISGREADIFDWYADCAGIIFSLSLIKLFFKFKERI
jgi:VanZ family protein